MSQKLKQSLEYYNQLLAEWNRRKPNVRRSITDNTFAKQALFVEDSSGLIAGFCTRRAGKSYGIGLKLFNACLKHDNVSCIYIALTRDSAKRIMFKDVFKAINTRHSLGCSFNHSELSVTFPNGSIIYSVGMDSSPDEMQKALGQKFKLAVIDEAGSFRQDLREIVYSILKPAVADLQGQIVLIGTANNVTKGLFYDVVWSKEEPGWSVHSWTAFDNPYMAKQWQHEIDTFKETNPRILETPWFKQNYLGEYVVDETKLVYKYSKANVISKTEIPELHNYVLGIDLGYNDATAFSLLGFREDGRKLYVVHTSKETKLTLTQVAERIEWYLKRYQPYKLIVDNAAKQAVEELKRRFSLPLTAADKTAKADFIEIMNNDFIAQNISVSDACIDLDEEYLNLIWDDRSEKKQEHPNCENHLADATLYAWRYCYQYVFQPAVKKIKLTDEEKIHEWEEAQSETLLNPKENPWWEN